MSRYKAPQQDVYRMPPPGARMLAYLRFSSADQDAASQESALRQWITERGWTVWPGGWFLDAGKTGSTTDHRDAFHAMLTLCERLASAPERPAGVALWKLDRLGRNFLDVTKAKSTLRGLGYCVVSMADTIPEDPTLAPLLETLLDMQAQGYLAEISKNTKRGHALLRSMGYQTGGRPPFGLMEAREPMGQRKSGEVRQGVRWVADPATAPRVAEAFAMRAKGATYGDILTGPLAGVYRTKTALPPFFGRLGYVTGAAVTQGLFDQVQAMTKRRRHREGGDNSRALAGGNLLTGLVFCGSCGARMGADSWQQRWRYFRCAGRHRDPNSTCRQGKMPVDLVEGPLLDRILSVFTTPPTFVSDVNGCSGGDGALQTNVARITREIAQVDAAIARLVEAVARGDALDSLLDGLKAKEAEGRRLRDELQLVQNEIASQRRNALTAEEVAAIVDELRRERNRADVAELRGILRMLVQRITITGREYQVEWRPEARPWFTAS